MKTIYKNKSRARLYDAISGVNALVGAAGKSSTWTILFPNLAAATDTYIIGGYYFQFVADGSEDYTKAGTVLDPVLVTIGGTPTATTAAANLVTAMHAFAGTSAWGFLYPDDSVGASNSTGTVTINFWPGTAQNAVTYITEVSSVGTNATITNTVAGVEPKRISFNHSLNTINTTGSSIAKEYYVLPDGDNVGDTANILTVVTAGSDTPTIVGKLQDGATANVEALFVTGAGKSASFIWSGTAWILGNEGNGTTLTFTPAA